ncbi:hypothetical protein F4782DRAFT_534800 [Xylaria castorea]|nr:hypothetical protein F4782DRAFT_534800 [Xylaria castorea]
MPLAPVVLADLGRLSKLPLELLFIIIGYLDVPSAARFTRVNRQAQFLLWSDKDYQLLRYCLFRELSHKAHPQIRPPYTTSRVPLKDVNYHTLAYTMSHFVCTRCSSCDQYTYRLDMRTGHNVCCLCPPMSLACISIITSWVEMDREEVKSTIPYRLPEGQLIQSFMDARHTSTRLSALVTFTNAHYPASPALLLSTGPVADEYLQK